MVGYGNATGAQAAKVFPQDVASLLHFHNQGGTVPFEEVTSQLGELTSILSRFRYRERSFEALRYTETVGRDDA